MQGSPEARTLRVFGKYYLLDPDGAYLLNRGGCHT